MSTTVIDLPSYLQMFATWFCHVFTCSQGSLPNILMLWTNIKNWFRMELVPKFAANKN